MYVPGVTVAATFTTPDAGSSVMPGGQVPVCVTVALPLGPSVAGCPFTLSFVVTFGTAMPPVPAATVPESGCGTTTPVTVTVSFTVAQFGGVLLSHSVYGTV